MGSSRIQAQDARRVRFRICKIWSVGMDGQESKRDMSSSGIQARDADQGMTQHLHYSRKEVSACALERDDLLHSTFMNMIADVMTDPSMLMFIDEAAWNKKTSARTKGWSLVGEQCMQRQCFGHGERFSILPVLTLDGIITYDIIPGSVTSVRFLQFLCELVVCLYLFMRFTISNAVYRSPFLIPTQVLEASLFWTTATFIIRRKCAHL